MEQDLDRLRCLAALLSATPTVSARLRRADRTVLEIRRPPHPCRAHAVVPPCWFRAHLAATARRPVPEGLQLLASCGVDIGVTNGTTALPAHVVRTADQSGWSHLLAVASPVDTVRDVAEHQSADDIDSDTVLRLHAVPDLNATVLAIDTRHNAVQSERAADTLRSIGMALAIHRFEQDLTARASHPATNVFATDHELDQP